jgi:ketosteroid isomerase-like protein
MAEDNVHAANQKVVREFLLAWERRDTDQVVTVCSENSEWTFAANPPSSGELRSAHSSTTTRIDPAAPTRSFT